MSLRPVFSSFLFSKKRNFTFGILRNLNSGIINQSLTQTVSQNIQEELPCRTQENNPLNHTAEHIGLFYTIPPEIQKQIFGDGNLTIRKSFLKLCSIFNETAIMIRQPYLELINYVKQMDPKKPVIRYVLYGKEGTGKSTNLIPCLHWAFLNGYLLVHVPWVPLWTRWPREVANSLTRPEFVDLPLDGSWWLQHFKKQNTQILNNPELRTTKEYTWSKREMTPKGVPLLELVDLGINRVKYSCDIISALIEEIKYYSTEGRIKTFVAIGGFNGLFEERTNIITDLKKRMTPDKVSLLDAFRQITKNDWSNGSILLNVCPSATFYQRRASDLPLYNMGKEGFEHLDPFVPIRMENYTEKEFHSCINYYLDRLWIQNKHGGSEEGRKELLFLSEANPNRLVHLCAPL